MHYCLVNLATITSGGLYVLFLSLVLLNKSPTCAVKKNFLSVAFIKGLSDGLSPMAAVKVSDFAYCTF